MKNKSLKLILVLLVLSLLLAACGKKEEGTAGTDSSPMQYIGAEDLKASIESDSYIILDVRKAEDYNTSHIKGSYGADQDAAKDGDDASGTANLKAALKGATGNETGNSDDKYVLVCYSGKVYAQTATDLMVKMGISKDNIYTLEGGIKAWNEAGDDYKALLE
ncbi:MAG: rhodanese-like domain-containing protein [Candidatus Alkaliphilus sp. MAG34]